jgi:hypothetical protein
MPSRKELNELYRDPAKPEDCDQIVQSLCDKVFNDKEISLAEEQVVGLGKTITSRPINSFKN